MIKNTTVRIFRLIATSLIALSPLLISASENSDNQEESPRWFEIEIILYKSTSEAGLSNESWKTDTLIDIPEEMIDFLQPFSTPTEVENLMVDGDSDTSLLIDEKLQNENQEIALDADKELDASTDIDSESSLSTLEIIESDVVEEELPFILLDDELLQLKTEAINISRHSSYQLLSHFSWRQPVLSKNEAKSIRIAGGFDHHLSFEYSGEKILEVLSADELEDLNSDNDSEDATTDELVISEDSLIENDSSLAQQDALPDNGNTEETLETEEILDESLDENDFQPIALPWVPEIDGSLRVYIYRNYLHVDTNLFYRRPDKEEVNIFEIQNQLPSLDIKDEISLPSDKFIDIDNSLEKNQFAWEYDTDFLSEESEKIFTERLFNYPLVQNRRLRSTELHYFDHPLIGMLIIIRPYELELEENEEQELASTSVTNR